MADGEYPVESVIFDSAGNLFGTAYSGGTNGYGVVFELSPGGTNWTESSLYSFCIRIIVSLLTVNPANGLIRDPTGNLYGKTSYGGSGSVVCLRAKLVRGRLDGASHLRGQCSLMPPTRVG